MAQETNIGEPVPEPSSCIRLGTGQSAIINFTKEKSPTGEPAAYGLSRFKEDTYLVELREKFVKAPDYEGSLKDKELNLKFQKCFLEKG